MNNRLQFNSVVLFSLIVHLTGFITASFLPVSGQDTDIADIKKEYAHIRNHLGEYRVVKQEQAGESAEGGILTAYFNDTIVRLIVEEMMGETGKRVTEYYFSGLNVFFIYDVTFTYNRPIYMDSVFAVSAGDNEWHDPSKTKKSEERFYFKNQSMIRWLDKNSKPMNLKSGSSGIKEKEWIKRSASVLSVFINTDQ